MYKWRWIAMIRQEIIKDLVEIKEKLESLIETLEIMSDEELMDSIRRAKEQPPKRDFEDFLREIGI